MFAIVGLNVAQIADKKIFVEAGRVGVIMIYICQYISVIRPPVNTSRLAGTNHSAHSVVQSVLYQYSLKSHHTIDRDKSVR